MWYIQLCHQLSLTQQFYLYHLCPGREKKKVDPGQLIVSCHPDAVLNAQGRHDACRQMEYRPVLKDYKGYKKEHPVLIFFYRNVSQLSDIRQQNTLFNTATVVQAKIVHTFLSDNFPFCLQPVSYSTKEDFILSPWFALNQTVQEEFFCPLRRHISLEQNSACPVPTFFFILLVLKCDYVQSLCHTFIFQILVF